MKRALLLVLLIPAVIGAAAPKKHKASPKELRSHLKRNKHTRHTLVVQIHHNQAQAVRTRRSISQLDNRISSLSEKLATTEDRLQVNKKRQVQVGKDLDKATKDLVIRSQEARMRLREIYMHGEPTLASAIVGSKSMADLATRQFIYQRITQRDRELFDDVRKLRQSVVAKKKEVDELVVEIKQDIDDAQTEKADLQDTRQEKTEALQQIKSKEGELEGLLRQLDAEDAAMESQIAQFEVGPGRSISAFHGRFMVPVFGARLASPFGMRYHPILHRMRMHTGQDFAIHAGTPIHAAAPGIVVTCTYMRGYGNCVVVDHGGGISTLYGHCSRFGSSPGQRVEKGQTIAYVGSTGLSTGPHCHFEVRIHGRPVNPMPYLRG